VRRMEFSSIPEFRKKTAARQAIAVTILVHPSNRRWRTELRCDLERPMQC